jgi:hypothetical protein
MNKGNAASAHELLEPQAVIARIDPTGDSVKDLHTDNAHAEQGKPDPESASEEYEQHK